MQRCTGAPRLNGREGEIGLSPRCSRRYPRLASLSSKNRPESPSRSGATLEAFAAVKFSLRHIALTCEGHVGPQDIQRSRIAGKKFWVTTRGSGPSVGSRNRSPQNTTANVPELRPPKLSPKFPPKFSPRIFTRPSQPLGCVFLGENFGANFHGAISGEISGQFRGRFRGEFRALRPAP